MSRAIKQRWLRILTFGMLIAAAVILRPAATRASDVGFRVGYLVDAEAFSMGMEMLTSLDRENAWFFNPNFEVAVGEERNVASLNGDFHYDFDTQSDAAVWLGAGPALLITDPDRPDSDNDVDPALNLLLGVGARTGSYRPFAQIKGVLSDNSDAAISVGIRF
jgi:hypothetical protein